MSGTFARAQREYDAQEPPDWDGVWSEGRECGASVPFISEEQEDKEEICEWSGKVDVYYAGNTCCWTCPACSTEHEEELEEPERERDEH